MELELHEKLNEIKDKLKKELKANLYTEVSDNIDSLFKKYINLKKELERANENKDYWKEKYYKSEGENSKFIADKNRYAEYYKEVCNMVAEKDIEIDVLKAKIELMKKEGGE